MPVGGRSYKPIDGTIGDGVCGISGSFTPNGVSAPTLVKGKGFTVAYTSTGTYTITLDQQYKVLLGYGLGLQLASAEAKGVQLGAVDVTSARTLVIRTVNTNTGAVAALTSGDRIGFWFSLSRSSLNV